MIRIQHNLLAHVIWFKKRDEFKGDTKNDDVTNIYHNPYLIHNKKDIFSKELLR